MRFDKGDLFGISLVHLASLLMRFADLPTRPVRIRRIRYAFCNECVDGFRPTYRAQ